MLIFLEALRGEVVIYHAVGSLVRHSGFFPGLQSKREQLALLRAHDYLYLTPYRRRLNYSNWSMRISKSR